VGSGFFPLDRELALGDKHWSEGVARRAVWLSGLLSSFEKGVEVLLKVGQVNLSDTTIWRLTERWGKQMLVQEEGGQEAAKAIPSLVSKGEEESSPRLGVAMDGTMINVREEGWKELKTGCVFEIEPRMEEDEVTHEEVEIGHAVHTQYVGYLGGPEVFGEKVWAEAQRQRWSGAAEREVIGDGAVWIWNVAGEHFWGSEQVVDWYHGTEHLAQAANLAYGEGTLEAKHWYKRQETVLYLGDVAQIVQAIEVLAERHPQVGEALEREAAYFEHNKRRMNYLELRAAGWVIGSGMVESGGKQFKARLAGPGMRWSRPGADRMICLRGAILSRRFDACWQAAYNSPLN
jgi:hypothetical protein